MLRATETKGVTKSASKQVQKSEFRVLATLYTGMLYSGCFVAQALGFTIDGKW